jgi:hypothetical protein
MPAIQSAICPIRRHRLAPSPAAEAEAEAAAAADAAAAEAEAAAAEAATPEAALKQPPMCARKIQSATLLCTLVGPALPARGVTRTSQ